MSDVANKQQVNITGTIYRRTPKPKSSKRKRMSSGALVLPQPKRTRVSGSGDYYLSSNGRRQHTPFGNVGETIGGFFGAPGLGFAGGHLIGRVLGSGDYIHSPYSVKNNILANQQEVPTFVGSQMSNVIRHREYIGDVISGASNTFNLNSYSINPGQSSTFPWLSIVAQNYEEYKFHGLIFEFKTMSSDALNSTNTSLGQVIMATEYNSTLPPFTTKQAMENYQFGQSCKPSLSMLHAVECAPSVNVMSQQYVRQGAVPVGTDQRLYDLGVFQIATNGLQGTNVNVGELWVTYCVEFFKPRLPQTISGNVDCVHREASAASTANPFGTAQLIKVGTLANNLSISGTNAVITGLLPGQKYLANLTWVGTSAANVTPSIVLTNATILNYWNNATFGSVPCFYTGTTASLNFTFVVATNSTQNPITATIGITGGTYPGSAICDFFVTNLDNTIDS